MPRRPHTFDHLAAFALAHPWALMGEMRAVIASIIARRLSLSGEPDEEEGLALAARARDQRDREDVPVAGGGVTAVIPIHGVIAPRMNMFSEISGGTTFDALTSQTQKAVADPDVKTIVYDVDSPGGNVAGASEFAAEVRRASAAKPTIAQVHHLMASAAYWAMSGVRKIVATPSAMVGSIGVYGIHDDLSEALAKVGIKREVISAGKYKAEGIGGIGLSEEGRAHLQHLINGAYDRMVGDIGKGRGVTAAQVRAGFGEGRVLSADDALAAGLIDGISTFADTLARATQPATAGSVRVAATVPPAITAEAPAQESRAVLVDAHSLEFERRVLALRLRSLKAS